MPRPAWLWNWPDWGDRKWRNSRHGYRKAKIWWATHSSGKAQQPGNSTCFSCTTEWGGRLANLGRGVFVGDQSQAIFILEEQAVVDTAHTVKLYTGSRGEGLAIPLSLIWQDLPIFMVLRHWCSWPGHALVMNAHSYKGTLAPHTWGMQILFGITSFALDT